MNRGEEEDAGEDDHPQSQQLSNKIKWYELRNFDAFGAPVSLTFKGQR